MLSSIVVQWTLYGNVATFYPPYRKDHHPSITDTMVGVVLAMFEFGILVISPLVSLFMAKAGRKNLIILGNVFMICASIGFGLLVYVENDTTFYILSLLCRFIQGSGEAMSTTSILSTIGVVY